MSFSPRFEICFPVSLAQECPYPNDWANPKNYSDLRTDRGGSTQCGITQRSWDGYCKGEGIPLCDVRQSTLSSGKNFYFIEYWLPHCDQLPVGFDAVFYDDSINMGCTEALRILCTIFGNLKLDFSLCQAAMKNPLWTPQKLIMQYTTRRMRVYQEMPTYAANGKGWENRAIKLECIGLKMANGGYV